MTNFSAHRALCSIIAPLLLVALAARAHGEDKQNLPSEADVVYGEADGQKLLLDVFLPRDGKPDTDKRPRPAMIFLHGGGWKMGNKSNMHAMATLFANRGIVAFTANYRLVSGGKNTWPACFDDAQRAVRWIRAHAEQYGIDPDRVGGFGASAGGHLVSLLATRDTRDNADPALAAFSSRICCGISMCGPADLIATEFKRQNLFVNSHALVRDLMGKTRDEAPDLYRDASPLFHIDAKTAPMLILHGIDDDIVPIDQSDRFYAALKKANIDATLLRFEGEGHGIRKKENQIRERAAIAEFLTKHLRLEAR